MTTGIKPLEDTPAGGDGTYGVANGGYSLGVDREGNVASSAYYIGYGDISGDLYAGQPGDTGNYTGAGADGIAGDILGPLASGGDNYATAVNNDMGVFTQNSGKDAYYQQAVAYDAQDYTILGQPVSRGPGDASAGLAEFASAAGQVFKGIVDATGLAGAATAAGAVFVATKSPLAAGAALVAAGGAISDVNKAVNILGSPLSNNEQAVISTIRNSAGSLLNSVSSLGSHLSGYGGPATNYYIPPN